MTLIEQNNRSYWLSAIMAGTLLNVLLFGVLPSLGHSKKPPEPQVITLDFIAWQEPVKQKAVETPKPKKQPKPKPKPKPKVVKKVEAPKPKPIEKPVLTDSIEPPPVQEHPELEEPIEEVVEEEVLPEPVPIFQVTNLPRVVHWQQPEYPTQMKALGREATVKVEVLIDRFGKVRQAVVIKSGGSAFDAAAVSAVEASSFLPANIDGQAVPVRYRIPIRFRLS